MLNLKVTPTFKAEVGVAVFALVPGLDRFVAVIAVGFGMDVNHFGLPLDQVETDELLDVGTLVLALAGVAHEEHAGCVGTVEGFFVEGDT